jgi:hypothetical protein
LQIVVVCESETSKPVIVVLIRVEYRDIVPPLLEILPGDNQKVVDVLRDGQVDRVNSDGLDLCGREIDVEFLEVSIVDIEEHLRESGVLFGAKHDVVVIVD